MADCVFCKVISGQLNSDIVFKDDKVVAIKDINPLAPVHLLIIPRQHIASLQDIAGANISIVTHMTQVANKLAEQTGIADKGYRVVINTGNDGGQVIKHLHMHLLGGKILSSKLG
ncbi:MAG: histidine triad nucleotide-binding protein [Dehalococcoidales bacterium]|nr:histidine triad nucleotide-binding protein [Dehalococcoidales bacterium]